PTGVFGQSLALAAFPALAEMWAKKEKTLFHEQFLSTLRQTFFLAIPVAALFVAITNDIIKFLYEHGKFGPEATLRVSSLLFAFGFGVPAWCALPVLTRAYFATKSTKVPVILSSLATLVFMGLCWYITSNGLPYQWLAWVTTLVGTALVLVQWIALEKRIGKVKKAETQATFLLSMVGGAVCGLVAWGLIRSGDALGLTHQRWASMAVTAFAGLCGAWAYYFFAVWAKMPEAQQVKRAMNRRRKKSEPPSS
ncbi:MAG: lipid II flippase MurJ, partial [Armatimonadota bacterium]